MLLNVVVGSVAAILIVVAFLIGRKGGMSYQNRLNDAKIGNAEEKAREIIDEALKTAENKKREALLEAKEENLKVKNDLDQTTKNITILRYNVTECRSEHPYHRPSRKESLQKGPLCFLLHARLPGHKCVRFPHGRAF